MILTCLQLFKGFCLKRPKSFCSARPSGLAPVFCLPLRCPHRLANTFAWTTLLPPHLWLVLQSLLQLSSPKILFSTDSHFHHVSLLYHATDRCELDTYLWFFLWTCLPLQFHQVQLSPPVPSTVPGPQALYKYLSRGCFVITTPQTSNLHTQAKCLNTTPWAPGSSFFLRTLPLNKMERGLVTGTPTGSFRLEETHALLSLSPLRMN